MKATQYMTTTSEKTKKIEASVPILSSRTMSNDKLPSLTAKKVPISVKPKSPRHQGIARLPKVRPINNTRSYRYKILPGNNSRVIMQSMKRRPWWNAIVNGDPDENIADQQPTFLWEMYRISARYNGQFKHTLLNHIQRNALLTTKKGIYLSIKSHCDKNGLDILSIIPRTFYIAPSDQSSQDDMEGFEAYNAQATSEGKNPEDLIWILKPASKTNRGFGIKVVRGLSAVMRTVHRVASAQSAASDNDCQVDPEQSNDKDNPLFKAAKRIARQDGYIVQQYLERPLLVDGRKFDIRCFVLVTVFEQRNGSKDKDLTAYFYPDAYVRTSSKKYSLDKLTDRATHLTNDAVQKHATNYGQFEQGNKLSLVEWQNLINKEYPHASSSVVASKVLPEIKRLCKLSIEACEQQLRCTEIQKSFELFGYDFMVTEDFDPLLIEVNTNPCLEFVCPLLTDIISNVIEDSFKIALDVAYPPPKSNRTKACDEACRLLQQESSRFEKLFPSS